MSELPKGWRTERLERLLADGPSNGYSPPSGPEATGTPTLRLSATTAGRLVLNEATTKRIFETIPESAKYWLEPGDILVQRANTLEYVGTAALYDGPSRTYIYPDLMMRVRPTETLDPRFLCLFLNSPGIRKVLRDQATGTAGNMPKISGATLRNLEVAFPPVKEQRRIVAKLEALQSRSRRAREALDGIPPLLEKLRQSILAAAFRGDLTKDWRAKHPDVEPASELLKRIRLERRKKWEEAELAKMIAKGKPPKDDRWKAKYEEPKPVDTDGLPRLPRGWCWASVEEVASDEPRSIQSGPFGSALLHSEFRKEGVLAIGIDNVLDGRFSMGSEHRISQAKFEQLAKFAARPGDVLVTVMATVGRCCVVPEELERAIITKHVYRVTPDRRLVRPEYLMQSMRGAPALRDAMKEDIRGQTRPGINGGVIRSLPVPVAPCEEQDEILDVVRAALDAAALRESDHLRQLELISYLERSVLAKAFRGRLAITDAGPSEVASTGTNEGNTTAPAPPPSAARTKRGRKRAS